MTCIFCNEPADEIEEGYPCCSACKNALTSKKFIFCSTLEEKEALLAKFWIKQWERRWKKVPRFDELDICKMPVRLGNFVRHQMTQRDAMQRRYTRVTVGAGSFALRASQGPSERDSQEASVEPEQSSAPQKGH